MYLNLSKGYWDAISQWLFCFMGVTLRVGLFVSSPRSCGLSTSIPNALKPILAVALIYFIFVSTILKTNFKLWRDLLLVRVIFRLLV